MTYDRWEILQSRIARLEDQNRWLKFGCGLAGIVIACILSLGSSSSPKDTVEAQRFVLRSADGKVRAELATLDGNYPKLTLLSPNGEKVAGLSPVGLSVTDVSLSAKLPMAHFGNTGLYFSDEHGQVVIAIGGASVSAPQLAPLPEIVIFDKKGQRSWRAP